MKKCPDCGRTYSDETTTFCLADGALLSPPYDAQATLHLRGEGTVLRATEALPGSAPEPPASTKQVIEDPAAMPTIAAPAPPRLSPSPRTSAESRRRKSGMVPWIVAAGCVIIVIVILSLYSRNSNTNPDSGGNAKAVNSANTTATPTGSSDNTVTGNATTTPTTGVANTAKSTSSSPPPPPSVEDLTGSVWQVTVTREGMKPWGGTMEFQSKGKVKRVHEGGIVQPGTWSLKGDQVQMNFPETYDYAGQTLNLTINADEMTGVYAWHGGYRDNYLLRRVK